MELLRKENVIRAFEKLKKGINCKKDADEELRREKARAAALRRELEAKNEYDTVKTVPIDCICPTAKRKSEDVDDQALIALADSIRRCGQITPLIVRRLSDDDSSIGGIYSLVCGERRYRALRMLGRSEARCIIVEGAPDDLAAISLCDDLHQKCADMFERADAISEFASKFSLTEEEAADRLSLARSTVRAYLSLAAFTKAERSMILSSGVGECYARLFLSIEDVDERTEALRYSIGANFSFPQAQDYIERCKSGLAIAGEAPASRRKLILRDVRIFYNTVDRAVAVMREAGVEARCERFESEGGYSVTVTIPKAHRKAADAQVTLF